jgi:alkaline phosphatase D
MKLQTIHLKDGSASMKNDEVSFKKFSNISFDQRKANAVRAYWEWMPIRQVDLDDDLRVWRSFSMGSLLDLIILDTRHYARDITGFPIIEMNLISR